MSTRRLCGLLPVLCIGAVMAGAAPPSTPRLADGRPDLNGTWDNGGGIDFVQPQRNPDGSLCISGCPVVTPAAPATRLPPDRPRYRPEMAARVDDLKRRQQQEDPVLRCQPPGVPRIGPPDKIVHTALEVVFLYEDVSGPFFRIVPLRPDVRRADDSQSYLGDATGHWEGDTLVVVTRNFNDLTWLTDDGSLHSRDLVVTEWLTRRGDEIEYLAVADDPGMLAEPWRLRPRRLLRSEVEMAEPAPCVEQDLEHMVDDSYHANPR